jgi:transcriptional regulator with XRE-family HTH domain
VHGLRRTSGLRREELATLAGISNDYYIRLERGKPSATVVHWTRS